MRLRDLYQDTSCGTGDLVLAKQASFNGIPCDFYDSLQQEEIYMTRDQIGTALGYSDPSAAVAYLHKRHKARLDKFSTTVKLTGVEGGRNVTREMLVYSPKGVYEICRWSRQPKADDFMDFVWNVVEGIRKNKITPPLTTDEIVDRAAQKVASQLLPQFFKSIAPSLAKNIIEQIRSLPQGETLLPPIQQAETLTPQPIKKKRGRKIMKYTIHTWRIIETANGLEAIDKEVFVTTDYDEYMAKLFSIRGTGLQYVVNREALGVTT